jgi:hypothetical protein
MGISVHIGPKIVGRGFSDSPTYEVRRLPGCATHFVQSLPKIAPGHREMPDGHEVDDLSSHVDHLGVSRALS